MRTVLGAALAASLCSAVPAAAATFVVDAMANSTTGGTGLPTVAVSSGDAITISSSTDDLWSAGALPRFSDANGLTAVRLATAADDSGQAVGTQIGADFGLLGLHGLNLPFGSLVGEINGVFQLLGANFSGSAWDTGTLNLYYWDSNNGDNFGTIAFDVGTGAGGVPEPAGWALAIVGLGLVGGAMRRRKHSIVAVSA